MNFKKTTANFLLILIFITSFTPIINSTEKPNPFFELTPKPQTTKNWTFMIYFCADTRDEYVTQDLDNSANWLAADMLNTIHALRDYDLLDGSESNLNVIALFDHPYSVNYPNGQAKLYEVQHNAIIEMANYGPKNMGNPYTLRDFINYCKTNYPANNYALVLSDHGRGYAGICYDYHAPHPSYEYALGDCLLVPEIEQGLSLAGGVDVLIFDTCLGGSFEIMWQLRDEADYVVAGETLQSFRALYHPRDILYTLSRDTSMTPFELAEVAFNFAENPVYVPQDPYISEQWKTSTMYDLDNFEAIPLLGGYSLFYAFDKLTEYLYQELLHNLTYAREVFRPIRDKLIYSLNAFSSKAMMVDLGDFVMTLLEHSDQLYYQTEIENYGTQVLNRLVPSISNPIVHHAYVPAFEGDNFTGFSICFPYTQDMYQEYLYANLYDTFDISDDTYWDEFIFGIYPPNETIWDRPLPEYYEELHIFLHPIDPTVSLHIFIDTSPFEAPLHIGYTGPFTGTGMGIEVGVEGASFEDTLIFGSTMISIPVASIPSLGKDVTKSIQVVVNASTAASTSMDVNLTVRHVDSTGVLWEATKTSDIQIGQIISTNVTTNDEWTDWEELAPPVSTKKFPASTASTITISLIFISMVTLIFRRNKKG